MPTKPATDDLPFIPLPRSPGCPLAPPAEFAEWRESEGLQLASCTVADVDHQPIRRHQSGPRRPTAQCGHHSGRTKATSSDNKVPQIFPRIDDPEHNRCVA